MRVVPETSDLFDAASSLVAEVRRRQPNFTSKHELLPRQLAAAALARGVALLDGLVTLGEDRVSEIGGLLARAIWECWIIGLYLILAPDDALMLLTGAHRRDVRTLVENWPKDGPGLSLAALDVDEQRINFEVTAKTVSDLLIQRGGPTLVGHSYAILYRTHSTATAHATYMSLMRHIDSGDWLSIRPAARTFGDGPESLSFGIMAVSVLAFYVYREFGLRLDAIVAFADRNALAGEREQA
jgi:hypothetical protein